MEHARPRLEFDLTAHCSQALGHSDRIIAQCLVAADMNESRWQARQIAVKRRGVGRARISASEIKVDFFRSTRRLLARHLGAAPAIMRGWIAWTPYDF
jgi:hypothetical protein